MLQLNSDWNTGGGSTFIHIYANELCHLWWMWNFGKTEFSHCEHWRQKLNCSVGSGNYTPWWGGTTACTSFPSKDFCERPVLWARGSWDRWPDLTQAIRDHRTHRKVWLDSVIWKVFSNLNNLVVLWSAPVPLYPENCMRWLYVPWHPTPKRSKTSGILCHISSLVRVNSFLMENSGVVDELNHKISHKINIKKTKRHIFVFVAPV